MKRSYTQFDIANRTARHLLEINAVRFDPVNLVRFTSGRQSPIYIDTRLVCGATTARADIVRMAFSLIAAEIGNTTYQIVAGGETAGIPFAAWIADRVSKPMVYIRKAPKPFGRGAQIEGLSQDELKIGRKFLLVEDLCTDGGSKQKFIDAIRESGNIVNDIFVVFHYGCFGATTMLKNIGVRLHAMTDAATLVDVAEDQGLYPPSTIAAMRGFLADPDTPTPETV